MWSLGIRENLNVGEDGMRVGADRRDILSVGTKPRTIHG